MHSRLYGIEVEGWTSSVELSDYSTHDCTTDLPVHRHLIFLRSVRVARFLPNLHL